MVAIDGDRPRVLRWYAALAIVQLVVAIFMLGVGLNGLLVIPAIVILAMWVRAETRDYFGVQG